MSESQVEHGSSADAKLTAREPTVEELAKAMYLLATKADQRLAAHAGLAAVVSLMPGAALVNPAAAARIAANLIPPAPGNEPVRRLAAVQALTLVRMARAARVAAKRGPKAKGASAAARSGDDQTTAA
jgi:hypothetical protein